MIEGLWKQDIESGAGNIPTTSLESDYWSSSEPYSQWSGSYAQQVCKGETALVILVQLLLHVHVFLT